MLSVQPISYPIRAPAKKAQAAGSESDEFEDESFDDKTDATFTPSQSRIPTGSVRFGKSGPRLPFAMAPNEDQRVSMTGFKPAFHGGGYVLPADRGGQKPLAARLIGPSRSYMFHVDDMGTCFKDGN